MPKSLIGFEDRVRQSVRFFWTNRLLAAEKQLSAGREDRGNRGAVTAGKNLDAFRDLISDAVLLAGPQGVRVCRTKSSIALPGFFRPIKQWDLLVVHQDRLLAALELKSLCGPSFGNNANNRCEEALGNAVDFRKAQSEGHFGPAATPFLGYFILVEDSKRSAAPVATPSPHYPTDPIFQSASYQTRMKILCERMMEHQLYTSAAVMTSVAGASGNYSNLADQTSFRSLISRLAGHLAGEANVSGTDRFFEEPSSTSGIYRTRDLFAGNHFQSIE
ncbi:MAG: restriction endonuclease [Puniceicoccaceae bacterium]|nr:MAG: restriction endonuclease [Puniceicoccaceae bacterium]